MTIKFLTKFLLAFEKRRWRRRREEYSKKKFKFKSTHLYLPLKKKIRKLIKK